MKANLLFLLLSLSYVSIFAQQACGIPTPPSSTVRSIAEWEELDHIVVSWDNLDHPLLAKIIDNARIECEVVVAASNVAQCQNQLLNIHGFDDLNNITFIEAPISSIWIRDSGANSAYINDVDSLIGVDWIYNRNRPEDDQLFCEIQEELDIPLYQTLVPPYDLVHTGGNYMTDGLGMGFSSDLLYEENEAGSDFGYSAHSPEDVKAIMQQFLGIDEYVVMEALPYDIIHHIDMHMKLLDEETLLVGAYPNGISDGPQIEANLAYIQENYKTSFGRDFNIIRMDMPADANGDYPGAPFGFGDYYTYTNALFVNKMVLVPTYNIPEDQEALDKWREALPGYNIVGLDCRNIIRYSGAIHCITKEVGTSDPLWITHPQIRDVETEQPNGYMATAQIKHRSGIESANLYYKTNLDDAYLEIPMEQILGTDDWIATIPEQANQSTVYYYINAIAFTGKIMTRPMPAPEGYFSFTVNYPVSTIEVDNQNIFVGDVFPNPARSLTYIPFENKINIDATVQILDVHGRVLEIIHDGIISSGDSKFFFDVSKYTSGVYFVHVVSGQEQVTKRFVVR